jgi:hypothetical protein
MDEPSTSAPPALNAKVVGLVYLLYFVLAIGASFVGFTLARSLDVLSTGVYMGVAVLLSMLLSPAGPTLARLAQVFGAAGCTIQIGASLLRVAPIIVYHLSPAISGLPEQELSGIAFLLFSVSAQGLRVALVFFGTFCVLTGMLIVRSTFMPRILGWLLIVAGIGWLTFVWAPLASVLSAVVLPFGFLAELLLMLWLVFRGVRRS